MKLPGITTELAALPLQVTQRRPSGDIVATTRHVAVETPVEIRLSGTAVVVTMASPTSLSELAAGFLISEGYLPRTSDLEIEILPHEPGYIVDVDSKLPALREIVPRSHAAMSSCGLCGVQTLAEAIAATPAVTPRPLPDAATIHAALAALGPQQLLNQQTHAVHAAAWIDDDGNLIALHEDIGRHNALDKLLGARPYAHGSGFALVTSRLSYEMVQKAAMHDVSTLVAVSAPTSLAVRLADASGMNIVAIARDDSHEILCAGDRSDGR